jgi:hypothetical protein
MEEKAKSQLQDLQAALGRIESDRLKALTNLKEIQVVSQVLLQREADRLSRKLGKDHPRARQLTARLKGNRDFVGAIEVELEVARIRVPEVGASDVLIHGRVADENNRGLTGLNVVVEDEAGETIARLGTAKTDASGYYALRVDEDTLARLSEAERTGGYLTVRNSAGEVVQRESKPLDLAPGGRVVLNIPLRRESVEVLRERPIRPGRAGGTEEGETEMWVGRGRVTDEDGQGLGGLLVRLFDKDRRYDDKLGAALTDDEGHFEIMYRVQDFREGDEPGPDLYLTVTDREGNTLYSSEEAIKFDAGRVESFDITISIDVEHN